MARNIFRRLIGAAAVAAALSGAAWAQFPMPSVNLEQGARPRSPQEVEHDRAIDNAYQSATKKIPDQTAPNDPWATVRPAPTVPAKKKSQLAPAKKQQLSEGAKKPGE